MRAPPPSFFWVSALSFGLARYWILHSGSGFLRPALAPRLPVKSTPMPPQRCHAPFWDGLLVRGAAGAAGAGACGLIWVEPPGCIGGFGRFVMSEILESAFGPALTWTPAIETDCEL